MSCIGIDIGATYVKGAILDTSAGLLRNISRVNMPPFLPGLPSRNREISPDAIMKIVFLLLDDLLSREPRCNGIFVCNQMHGFVLCDFKGNPKSNFVSWQDERSLEPLPDSDLSYHDELDKMITVDEKQVLGNELRPSLPISKIYAIHRIGGFSKAKLFLLSLGDFIISNLCKCAPTTDTTNAAASGFFNLKTGNWKSDILKSLKLDWLEFPIIMKPGTVAGLARLKGCEIPVYCPLGDHQSALYGVQLETNELSINVATGSQVSVITDSFIPGKYQTRPYVGGKYVNTITHLPAGRSLNCIIKVLTELASSIDNDTEHIWEHIENEVYKTKANSLDMDLAFFSSPYGSSGHISKITERNLTVGNLFRAAYHNMANNYFRAFQQLSASTHVQSIAYSGGVVRRSKSLRQIISDRIGMKHRVFAQTEEALLGLLNCAKIRMN